MDPLSTIALVSMLSNAAGLAVGQFGTAVTSDISSRVLDKCIEKVRMLLSSPSTDSTRAVIEKAIRRTHVMAFKAVCKDYESANILNPTEHLLQGHLVGLICSYLRSLDTEEGWSVSSLDTVDMMGCSGIAQIPHATEAMQFLLAGLRSRGYPNSSFPEGFQRVFMGNGNGSGFSAHFARGFRQELADNSDTYRALSLCELADIGLSVLQVRGYLEQSSNEILDGIREVRDEARAATEWSQSQGARIEGGVERILREMGDIKRRLSTTEAIETSEVSSLQKKLAAHQAGLSDVIRDILGEHEISMEAALGLVPMAREEVERLRRTILPTPGLMAFQLPSQSETDATGHPRSHIDIEIDRAFEAVKNGQPESTIDRLEVILREQAVELDDRLRYRVHANIGHAEYARGDIEAAASRYGIAIGYYSESKDARALKATWQHLTGERAAGHETAIALAREYPDFARAHAMVIRTFSDSTEFGDVSAYFNNLSEDSKKDTDLLMAMAGVAQERGRWNLVAVYASKACFHSPDWPTAWEVLGTAQLKIALEDVEFEPESGVKSTSNPLAQQAVESLSTAIRLIGTRDPAAHLGGLYLNRSVAQRLIGKAAQCRADVAQAYSIDPLDEQIALAEASALAGEGKLDEAQSCLRRIGNSGESLQRDVVFASYLKHPLVIRSRRGSLVGSS